MTDDTDLSLPEVNQLLTHLCRTIMVHERLIEDLLTCLTAIDPDTFDGLRRQAAGEIQKVHDNRASLIDADTQEALARQRFMILDGALARTGSFWKTADVVTLDTARS